MKNNTAHELGSDLASLGWEDPVKKAERLQKNLPKMRDGYKRWRDSLTLEDKAEMKAKIKATKDRNSYPLI